MGDLKIKISEFEQCKEVLDESFHLMDVLLSTLDKRRKAFEQIEMIHQLVPAYIISRFEFLRRNMFSKV